MQRSQPSRHGVSRKSLKMAEGKDENETLGEEETSACKPLRKQPLQSHLVCSAECWRMAEESSEWCWWEFKGCRGMVKR